VRKYIIRKGTIEDSKNIAEVFSLAGGDAIRWIFGKNYQRILEDVTKLKFSPFSYSVSHIIEKDDKMAGAVVTYPYRIEQELLGKLDRIWKKYYNISSLIGFTKRAEKWDKNFKKSKNCQYIHALAIFKKHRGQGLAGKLLEHVEEIALKNELSSITLEVISDNASAIKAYTKFGFEKIKTVSLIKLSRSFKKDNRVIFLMEKNIT
jgi:ribosomal protein S18 acetylase RimI-like enzyme